MRGLLIIPFALLSSLCLGAGLVDSVFNINKIAVVGAKSQSDNIAGSRRSVISPEVLSDNATRSVGDLLGDNSLVFVKSMGQGGLATAAFRGTSSNHTQVNWNGVNINSPMLGNFDFSQVPSFFTDDVTLYHGGGYLKNGTGALGGSINLNNTLPAGQRLKILGEYGSNQTYTGGIHAGFSTKKLRAATRLYLQNSENDFRYINKVLSMESFEERRADAAFLTAGAMQEFGYQFNSTTSIAATLWYMYGDRDLPQPIIIYNKPHEHQRTDNVRSVVSVRKKFRRAESNTTLSYLSDFMRYNINYQGDYGNREEENSSQSFVAKQEFSFATSEKSKLTATLHYRRDEVESPSYSLPQVSRNTFSLQGGGEWQPSTRLTLSLSGMGEANDQLVMPTFSSGARYVVVENLLDLSSSLSYNYRAPTLNDLHWRPGGNPDLSPERGFSYDATMALRPTVGSAELRLEATYYRTRVTDWIAWMPGNTSYWSPQNIKDVLSSGCEIFSELSLRAHSLIFNYGYARSVSMVQDATHGKQLPYIPVNRWNLRYALNGKKLLFWCNAAFADKRYTNTDQSQSTPSYLTLDAEAGYRTTRHSVVKVRVNNILDTYYESTKFNPMPLRSIYGSLVLNF